ncbi:MAG: MBL fold metallo-hydrolase [Candidatus Parcubacteria bacterium]|nr:MBL fold metallo-hydrolase [Candidatus Parcubacteria bacterium]
MIITYYGAGFVKLQFGDVVVGMNPISKESTYKSGRFAADVSLVSINHKDFSGTETLSFGDKSPFAVNGPGEYEINGITIAGVPSKSQYDGKDWINTIYLISLEDMRICHLGALSDTALDSSAKERLDEVDVLFVTIGGPGLITPAQAYKMCVDIGPKIIIPLFFDEEKEKNIKAFLKEAGSAEIKPVEKLTLKKKDLEGKDGEIVILSSVIS